MQTGILYALAAYLMWGLLPLFLKQLQGIPAGEVLLHRMVWSLVFLGVILAVRRNWRWLGTALRQPKVMAGFAASAALLAVNWFVYIWSVQANRVVDASLGYFINPLVSVLIGVVVLRERLRLGQWLAVAVAGAGVAWLTWQAGQLPWIAITLALSFGFYGLLRKTASLGALEGLSLETLVFFPVAGGVLAWLLASGQAGFDHATPWVRFLCLMAGPVTAVPLLLFAAGARRIPMSLLGILQYAGPTVQLLLGVLLWHEPFGAARVTGFALIWGALLIYTAEGFWAARRRRA
ncbi:EamA family transporter RarD [Chitiniphilus eburneus]|uniref:EamA family transporter RarD n=1 Tax=Chitiniphilus eburneus TaxID=2571148 RepID=A0A4U0PLG5_9NEIS|nr:EamA family transporter RarD [Chitiniphilus eburneus]TJZ69003.1 EamA family transporter RarD [Chitiniphilus eburneus]